MSNSAKIIVLTIKIEAHCATQIEKLELAKLLAGS